MWAYNTRQQNYYYLLLQLAEMGVLEQFDANRHNDLTTCRRDFVSISEAFVWIETPEGLDYWANISIELRYP